MNRDKNVIALRPIISNIDLDKEMSGSESFQNHVLRPILKFQSEILVEIIRRHFERLSIDITKFSPHDRSKQILRALQKDSSLKNLLVGCIIGQMSLNEVVTFYENENELRKRIIKMTTDRCINQL